MIKKYGLVILLTIIAVIMVSIKLRYKDMDWGKEADYRATSPTPTIASTPTPAPKINEDYPLWQELPYEGDGFVIDRYVDKKTVVVQRKGLDKKIVEQEVYSWFEENNVATEEMKIKYE